MTTLTIRIEENLKNDAFNLAEKLGIPLTLVVKSALKSFVETKRVVIGSSKQIKVTPDVQKKMDKIGRLLSKSRKT